MAAYPMVRYVYKSNGGLSSARNAGIDKSAGELLVFLDADDWYFPGALSNLVACSQNNPHAAFVYGDYRTVSDNNEIIPEQFAERAFTENHYCRLLQQNFIAMHGTVFYSRWIFDQVRFDPTLKAAEDYDVYLKITRQHPIVYHPYLVAAYRRHSQNMSGNVPLMLNAVLTVLKRQEKSLRTAEESTSYNKGQIYWKNFYGSMLRWRLEQSPFLLLNRKKRTDLIALFQCDKGIFFNYLLKRSSMGIKSLFKQKSPAFLLSFLHRNGLYKSYKPAVGKIIRGDFNSTKPFSTNFGYDRGGPVDRYYIENFLARHEYDIKGRVLEIGDNDYTLRFGGTNVLQSDVLHVEENNPKATFVGDLSNAPQLPDNSFDCIVLTQTLHLIYHHLEALQTCYRILKPGGVLLLTVPGITHIDQGEWRDYWFWAYTQAAINKLLGEVFPADHVQTTTHGNVLVASAFLFGMGLPELKKEEMDTHDPHYQVIITARAVKPVS